ncbi:unnamed protein product [Urochloa humidicola]
MDLDSSTSHTFSWSDLPELTPDPVAVSLHQPPPVPKQLLLFNIQVIPRILWFSFVNTSRACRRPPRCFVETTFYTPALLLDHNYRAGDVPCLWSRQLHLNLSTVKQEALLALASSPTSVNDGVLTGVCVDVLEVLCCDTHSLLPLVYQHVLGYVVVLGVCHMGSHLYSSPSLRVYLQLLL